MPLKTKVTIALLAMSFAAIAVVGATARWIMLDRFEAVVVDRAMEGFKQEVLSYYRTYGSWEAADRAESFFAFTERRRRGAPAGAAPEETPPRPSGVRGGPERAPGRPALLDGDPPAFAVTDPEGRVVVPLTELEVGDLLTEKELTDARQLLDGSKVIGLAVPREPPRLTALEAEYLSAIRNAWLYSLLLASALAIPLGLVLGNRLTRPIREMTDAMGEMKAGSLRQRVTVDSADELGQLARTFNLMSQELADAYQELEESRAQLDDHAQAMAELSRRDALTGLFNRRAFDELAEALLARARRYEHDLSVAMLDIDRFKGINDDFSHAVGDQVLHRTGRILTEILRETDLVARYGGEEFVIAFPETSGDGARILAERLRMKFAEAGWDDLLPGRGVTVSIGVTQVAEGERLADALARADERLYAAKSNGRNRVEG